MDNFESSWYIEILLISRDSIRDMVSKSFESDIDPDEIDSLCFENIPMEFSIDSYLEDAYDDLLTVEKMVSLAVHNGLIPQNELKIVELILGNNTFSDIQDKKYMTRFTASRGFKKFCARIGFYLGGKFTNSGFIEYMANKYKLSEKDVLKLEKFIVSNRRFT